MVVEEKGGGEGRGGREGEGRRSRTQNTEAMWMRRRVWRKEKVGVCKQEVLSSHQIKQKGLPSEGLT